MLPRPSAESQLGTDLDRALEAAGDGTESSVESVNALHLVAAILGDAGQAVADGDPPDHQDVVLVNDIADRLYLVGVMLDFDLTRLQRAGERAGQSPAGGRHDVVERRRVRRKVRGRNAVVLGHLGMDPECDRLLLGGQIGQALWTAEPLDAYP